MHHPRHAYTIRNLRIAAFLFCFIKVVAGTAVVMLVTALVQNDPRLSLASLGVLGLALLLSFVQWIYASSAKCPLCMMPVLSRKGCSTHRLVGQLLGSRRLRVAHSILLKGHFRCPYCNEPTAIRLRPIPVPARR